MIRKLPKGSTILDVIEVVNKLITKIERNTGYVAGDSEEFEILLDKFIESYPTKTSDGRILSPRTGKTVMGEKIKKKVVTITDRSIDMLYDMIKNLMMK